MGSLPRSRMGMGDRHGAFEIMHTLKLLMHRLQLPLNVIALGKAAQRSQRKLQMMLGIDQQAAMQAAGFIAHDNTTSDSIEQQSRLDRLCASQPFVTSVRARAHHLTPRSDPRNVPAPPRNLPDSRRGLPGLCFETGVTEVVTLAEIAVIGKH